MDELGLTSDKVLDYHFYQQLQGLKNDTRNKLVIGAYVTILQ